MIGWLDCSAGASGDMLLGAFLDAGADLDVVRAAVETLGVEPITVGLTRVQRHQIGTARAVVEVADSDVNRTHADVRTLLTEASLADEVRELSLNVFARLADAESEVHDVPADDVHFHEVGALDSLADVVGVCAAYVDLGRPTLTCSPVAVGSGAVRTRHGLMPVPVPAVVTVFARAGVPILAGAVRHEACTPTAAALIAELASAYGDLPAMTPTAVGVGAGQRDPAEAANICRLVLGTAAAAPDGPVMLEANVDDQDPRLWPVVIDALLAAGASDAWTSPIVMKKGRPAYTIHALCSAAQIDQISAVIFTNTTTIGLRVVPVSKRVLQRGHHVVNVDGHEIAVKIATLEGATVNVSVEFEDVKHAADQLGRSVKEVMARATTAAWNDQDAAPGGMS